MFFQESVVLSVSASPVQSKTILLIERFVQMMGSLSKLTSSFEEAAPLVEITAVERSRETQTNTSVAEGYWNGRFMFLLLPN